MSKDGQGTKRRRQICETFNRLSTAHKRYRYRQTTDRQTTDGRQMTDGRVTAYSEREREFTLAKTGSLWAMALGFKALLRWTDR